MDTDGGTWVLQHSATQGTVYFVGVDGPFRIYNPNPARALPFPDRRAAETFAKRHPSFNLTPQRRHDDPKNIIATG